MAYSTIGITDLGYIMKQIALGQTGIVVSQVGLGTVKFGRNQGVKYPKGFELPTDREIEALLSLSQELGINLLDTAPAYGTSEERLGKLLRNKRHEWVICGKVGEEFVNGESTYDFSATAVQKSIERSLKRLGTDYIDVMLVHSNGDDQQIIESGIFTTLNEVKQAGKIRSFGMSTKTVEGGLLAVEQSDVVMVMYNPIQTEEQPVIAHAHKTNKGIFVKKALASGHVDQFSGEDPVRSAMQFVLAEPGVSSVIVGTINPAHLKHNVACVG